MVLSIDKFDEMNNQAGVADFVHDLEEQIDKKMLDYAKADSKTRREYDQENARVSDDLDMQNGWDTVIVAMREGDCGTNQQQVVGLYNSVPNKFGKRMNKFSEYQQAYIRKTVVKDYNKQGWFATWKNQTIHESNIKQYHTYVLNINCKKLANLLELAIK